MRILGSVGLEWRGSDAEGEDLGRIGGIVVEALAALPAIHPGQNHTLEERRRGVALLSVPGKHDLGDRVGRIQANEFEERERSRCIAPDELQSLVDMRLSPQSPLQRTDS